MVNSGYRRADRVEVSVQRALSEILTRELPQELPSLVTVTAVRMSPDLRHANVFVASFSDDPDLVERSFAKLLEMKPFIRKLLPRYAPMKYVPNLHFERDDQVAYGTRRRGPWASGSRGGRAGGSRDERWRRGRLIPGSSSSTSLAVGRAGAHALSSRSSLGSKKSATWAPWIHSQRVCCRCVLGVVHA